VIVAVIAAVAAGCTFAVGSVLQQRVARRTPASDALSWRLLVDLARHRAWLVGIGSDVVSFGLQALALAFGPLALVQPLLVCGLLFAVPLSIRANHRRPTAREWAGTLAVAGGLAMFLAAASPSEGTPQTGAGRWAITLVAAAGLMAMATVAGRSARGPLRPSLYGLAAGTAFGVLAALTKTSTWLLGHGAVTFFTAWQPYAMAVVAVLGAIVQQSAYQSGPLAASVPVMDATEPTVAVLIGLFAFSEHIGSTPAALAVEVMGVLALLAGIAALDRSPAGAERSSATEAATRRPPVASGSDGRLASSSAYSGK
jgi:drug/metabolite transporter (DMT)-like permease